MPIKNFLRQLFDHKENSVETVIATTELLNLRISKSTLIKELENHPDSGSLLSISDLFRSFGMETMGVSLDPSKMADIPTPFITQISVPGSPKLFFTVVKQLDNKLVHFFDPEKHNWNSLSINEFAKRSSENALLIDEANALPEPDYESKIKSEKYKKFFKYFSWFSIPCILIAYIVSSLLRHEISSYPESFMFFSLLGAGICLVIIWYELDIFNPALNQICKSSSKKVNCSAVLNSNGAQLFGVGWSVIGFSYFSSLVLYMLFVGMHNFSRMSLVATLTSLSAPYIIYSLYYQWRVVKGWCVFCLFVQAILLAQVIIVLSANWLSLISRENFSLDSFLKYSVCLLIPFLSSFSLLRYAKKSRENSVFKKYFQKLVGNSQIFELLLKESRQVSEIPQDLGIRLGSKDADFEILKVCNPYCDPCAKAHPLLDQLLESNPRLSVKILFHIYPGLEETYAPPAKHLLAIAEQDDEVMTKMALDDWYSAKEKNYETFSDKYPLSVELKEQDQKIGAMQAWCKNAKITSTPSFFIKRSDHLDKTEGYFQLPEFYSISTLKYILPAL